MISLRELLFNFWFGLFAKFSIPKNRLNKHDFLMNMNKKLFRMRVLADIYLFKKYKRLNYLLLKIEAQLIIFLSVNKKDFDFRESLGFSILKSLIS